MKLHGNAALSLKVARRMVASVVEQDRSITEAAEAAGVSDRTCSKWVAPLSRRRARPGCWIAPAPRGGSHNRTDEQTVQLLAALRRLRFTAPELADLLDMPISTISGCSSGSGWASSAGSGLEPAVRYERERPGELIHIDVKKLGRIQGGAGKRITGDRTQSATNRRRRRPESDAGSIGWDAVHVAIDDATRLAYVEVLPDEKAITAVGFLRRAIAFYERHGITVERVHDRQRLALHLDRPRDRLPRPAASATYAPGPTGPQTNGKAERFIRTMLAGWAYGAIYASSAERTAALDGWLWHYNHHRQHSAIGRQPPITRLNNLLGTYS